MFKKVLLVLCIATVLLFTGVAIFARYAPGILRQAIERAVAKDVRIASIDYYFPARFVLRGFQILEEAPFQGEPSFTVDRVVLSVSPVSLFQKNLVLDAIEVENAEIVIRKHRGKLLHTFSNALGPGASGAAQAVSDAAQPKPVSLPLEIRRFHLGGSRFQYLDYDVREGGFVIGLDRIGADVRNIALPAPEERTVYRLSARLLQGRDQKPAELQWNGWTHFGTLDTDASLSLAGVHLPYFRAYTDQVTQAAIQEGYADARAVIRIQNKRLNGDIDFEIMNLLFESYDSGGVLFDLKAEELLSFLKDSSGHLRFQISFEWNIADRSVRLKDVLRGAIGRSLKATVLGNVGHILQNVIQKVGESGPDAAKSGVEEAVDKIRDFLRY